MNTVEAVLRIDRTGLIIQANETAEKMFSCPAQELVKRSLYRFLPTSLKNELRNNLAAESGKYFRLEGYDAHVSCWLEYHIFPADQTFIVFIIDVTSRLRTEMLRSTDKELQLEKQVKAEVLEKDNLRVAQERLRMALEAAKMGTWELDLESGKIFFSENAHEALGISSEHLPRTREEGRSWVMAEDREEGMEDLERVIQRTAEGGDLISEFRIRPPDSREIRWIESRSRAESDATGRVVRIHGIFQDVTMRKSREMEIERLARLAEESPNPILRIMRDGTIDYANSASRPLQEAWGRRMGEQLPAEWALRITEVIKTGTVRQKEMEDSKGRLFCCALVPVGEDGYVNIYSWDISKEHSAQQKLRRAQKQLERRVSERTAELTAANRVLRQSEERLRVALRNAPISLSMVDRNLRYVWIHLHTADVPEMEQLVGKRADSFLPPEEAARLDALREKAIRTGVGSKEEMVLHLGGNAIDFDVLVEPFRNEAGEVEGATTVSLDITERKRNEQRLMDLNEALKWRAEQLRHLADELTKAEERERRRIARVLHDHMQQILVAAKINIGILQGRMSEKSLVPVLDEISALINDSIATTRSLTAELVPPMLYDRGLPEALGWLAHWMREKHGLEVDFDLDPKPQKLPQEIEVVLYQAVRELLFNVVKHANVKRAILGSCYSENSVVFRVQDEGAGFVPREQEAARQDSSGGFGLIALRERLAMLDGQLSISSTPGRGTTATILLPAKFEKKAEEKEKAGAVQPATASQRTEGGPRRVLLADDHPVMRQGLTRLLQERPGMEVVGEASDGEQAVELTKMLHPDVVVMDVNMPRLNGVDATRIIHNEVPGVRVVGLSMFHHTEARQAMSEAGAAAYLPKDAPISELLSAISGS